VRAVGDDAGEEMSKPINAYIRAQAINNAVTNAVINPARIVDAGKARQERPYLMRWKWPKISGLKGCTGRVLTSNNAYPVVEQLTNQISFTKPSGIHKFTFAALSCACT